MQDIPKYSFGFKWFGPLEQCDDGEIMKRSEVYEEINRLITERDYYYERDQHKQRVIESNTKELNKHQIANIKLNRKYNKLVKSIKIVTSGILFCSICLGVWLYVRNTI